MPVILKGLPHNVSQPNWPGREAEAGMALGLITSVGCRLAPSRTSAMRYGRRSMNSGLTMRT